MIIENKKRKNKLNVTTTTGDVRINTDHFNKMLLGKEANIHTDGLANVELQKAAEDTAKSIETFASKSPNGAGSIAAGASSSDGNGVSESLNEDSILDWYIENWN